MKENTVAKTDIINANKILLNVGLYNEHNVVVDKINNIITDNEKDITLELKEMWENQNKNSSLSYKKIPYGVLVYGLFINNINMHCINKWVKDKTITRIE